MKAVAGTVFLGVSRNRSAWLSVLIVSRAAGGTLGDVVCFDSWGDALVWLAGLGTAIDGFVWRVQVSL